MGKTLVRPACVRTPRGQYHLLTCVETCDGGDTGWEVRTLFLTSFALTGLHGASRVALMKPCQGQTSHEESTHFPARVSTITQSLALQVDEVVAAKPPCRVFLVLGWKGRPSRRVLIHLRTNNPGARQFLLLCTGQRGPCHNGTTLFAVGRERQPGEFVWGGDYERNNGLGGAALLPDLDKCVYGESWMAGVVWGRWCDPAVGAQFGITTKDWPGLTVPCVIGKVEVGLEVVQEAARHRPITEVTVVDCGVVVD
ncbi:Peptidyl-prolyl cis-trans isomerase [Chionoecetes opilio]|uniref:Peptidyl-prolyl cis-trans isomerase n=1 Tax=Chionoecetes opilio TaxID=41210 RepID=A0A8J4YCT2_CHIOP|nr:Peptidyl-prolyl cis-trans isomerase [Chionoecetes opilio]